MDAINVKIVFLDGEEMNFDAKEWCEFNDKFVVWKKVSHVKSEYISIPFSAMKYYIETGYEPVKEE